MKLCAVSDSLGNLSFNEAAKASADLGLAALEIGTGNWSSAPHANLQSLLSSKEKRQKTAMAWRMARVPRRVRRFVARGANTREIVPFHASGDLNAHDSLVHANDNEDRLSMNRLGR